MPVSSYLENSPTPHVKQWRDASEHTRYVRMAATVAPYINTPHGRPTLGWKTNELSMQIGLIKPVYGVFKSFAPNSS